MRGKHLEANNGGTAVRLVVAFEFKFGEKVLQNAWHWLEIFGLYTGAIDRTNGLVLQPLVYALIAKRMFTVRSLRQSVSLKLNYI